MSGTKRALLIGNAFYDAGFEPLPSTHVDVAQLKAVLAHPSVGSYEVEEAIDWRAFELKLRIERFLADLQPDDLGLLYMSGHGARLKSTTGEFLFLAKDSKAGVDTSGDTAVSASFLDERLQACQARQKIVILDACFSGGFSLGFRTRAVKSDGRPEEALLRTRGCYVISSSAFDQLSYAGHQLENRRRAPSIFTGHLVQALQTAGPGRDGSAFITVDELFDAVSDRMRVSGSRVQTPVKSAHWVSGRVNIARRRSGSTSELSAAQDVAPDRSILLSVAPTEAAGEPKWASLLEYYRCCLKAAAGSFPLLTPADCKTRYASVAGPERIIAGVADGDGSLPLTADDPCFELMGQDEQGSMDLFYGYPVVVLREGEQSSGQTQIGALFIQKLRMNGERLQRDGEVMLHPRLKDVLLQRSEGGTAWLKNYKPAWQGGNRTDARAHIVWLLRERFALEASLDMTQLIPEVELGTPTTRVCNSAIYFLESRAASTVTERLAKDLEDIEKRADRIADTALGALLGPSGLSDTAQQPEHRTQPLWRPCMPLAFNDAQMQVLQSAMTQKLTVTMGPPGTGKSQLVANIVASCIVSEQRVLLASTNNGAVDVVCQRLNDCVTDSIVRTGNKAARDEECKQLERLLKTASAANRSASTMATAVQNAAAELEVLESVRQSFRQVSAGEYECLAAQLRASETEKSLARDWAMSEDEVRSRLHRARAVRWRVVIAVAGRITLLAGFIRFVVLAILGLPRRACARAFGAVVDWAEARHLANSHRERLRGSPSDEALRSSFEWAEHGVQTAAKELLKQTVHASACSGREQIDTLLSARDRSGWRELGAVLRHVRAWGVTALSARRFPLHLGHGKSQEPPFDLVIVDEASQCQIADILPVLFRAKRALIIGDPMQLGPIGDLSPSQQSTARRSAGITASWLDDRCLTSHRYSVFHAAQRAAPVTLLLDEHYRCHPHIAEFANHNFYQGRLVVLSATTTTEGENERAIKWLEASGAPYRRAGSWANGQEADAIRTEVKRLLAHTPDRTVGVISPLRAQKDLLDSVLPRDSRLRSGTVHTFQGGEQDIILLSLVLGPDMAAGTRRWLANQRNLWNVAITRARTRLIIVGDRTQWIKQGGIGAMLAEATNQTSQGLDADDFQVRLHRKLRGQGINAEVAVEIGGYRADAMLRSPHGDALALLVDRGCGALDPAKHLRVQLRIAELIANAGRCRVERVPAWRLFDSGSLELCRSDRSAGAKVEPAGYRSSEPPSAGCAADESS